MTKAAILQRKGLGKPLLPDRIYQLLFFLLALVAVAGLFVPLMDRDSAHHADIALHMYLTGDYTSLVDHGKDYLDKPHLHFWLCALSYKVFGVTGFAYKFPSFLFSISGVYSTYRLGWLLYNKETGKLAALILASSFTFLLANNDVRMDAILTAAVVFSSWKMLSFISGQKPADLVLSALGLAIGFSVKGHIGVLIPLGAAFFFILSSAQWKALLNPRWFLLIILFGLFISPVLYSYYIQYNLHPEKIVRGRSHINGVRFILLEQPFERFSGERFGGDNKRDYFFFFHTFLWAFAPWSLITVLAFAERVKKFRSGPREWVTPGSIILMMLIITFSGFKLPHYLNVIFPFAAIFTAAYLVSRLNDASSTNLIYRIQLITAILFILLLSVLNGWIFPLQSALPILILVILLAFLFYTIKTPSFTIFQKGLMIPAATTILVFFSLNTNFYPSLLKYQGGKQLADMIKGKVGPTEVYNWEETYSSSFYFYTKSLRKPFSDTILKEGKKIWLLYDKIDSARIAAKGYKTARIYEVPDYPITKLSLRFLDPAKRDSQCTKLVLAEIYR